MPIQNCPEKTDLLNYLSGGVSDFHADSIGLHIQSCQTCLKLLDVLDQEVNQRLGQVGNSPSKQFVEEAACDALPDKILDLKHSRLVSEDVTAADFDTPSSESFAVAGSSGLSATTTPGQLGDYRLIEKIGRGGMGVVWKAIQLSTRREVALKILGTFGTDELEAQTRFEREIELAASLDHPNITRVYEGGKADDRYFYAMQLIDGNQLDSYVDKSGLTQKELIHLLIDICRGVEYAHQNGVIHRDLKPQNILINKNGHPYIADFGLAKITGQSDELTMTGQVLGTPAYMPPEQIANTKQASTSVDVYGLGAIMFRILTGRSPFQGENAMDILRQVTKEIPPKPSSINRDIDLDLETICLKCLEKKSGDRFASTSLLLAELIRWQDGVPIVSRPVKWPTKIVKWAKRRPLTAVTTAAFFALVVISVCLITWKWLEADYQKTIAQTNSTNLAIEEQRKAEYLYVAHMNMIQQAWDNGLAGRARELLDRHIPVQGGPDLRTFEWYYYDALCRQNATIPTIDYDDIAVSVAADPIDAQVAIAGNDLMIAIWELKPKRRKIGELKGHRRTDKQMKFSDNGRFLLSCDEQSIHVWKKHGAGFESVFETNSSAALLTQISGDGGFVAVIKGQDIEIFNTRTSVTRRLAGHSKRVTDICFANNGHELFSSSGDRTIRKWDLASGESGTPVFEATDAVHAIEVSDDDSTLAFAYGDQLSMLRLVSNSTEMKLGKIAEQPKRLASMNNGKTFAVETSNEISFWSFMDGKFTGRLNNSGQFRNKFSISKSGTHFATCGVDSAGFIWDTNTLELTRRIRGHSNTIYGLAFLPTGGLISASRDHSAKIWSSLETTDNIRLNDGATRLWSLSFSADSKLLAVACEDSRIILWDTDTGTKIEEITHHTKSVQFVAFSPNGRLLASAGKDGLIRMWDLKQRKSAGELVGHSGVVNSLDFSADGQLLVSGGNRGEVIIWGVDSNKQIASHVSKQSDDVWAVAFGSKGDSVVFGGRCKSIQTWDFKSTNPPQVLHKLSENLTSLRLSPDGTLLSSTSSDGVITVFEYATRGVRYRLIAHSGDAMFAAFAPDGKTLVSAGSDGTIIQFWNLRTGEPTVSFAGDQEHIHSLAFAPDGKSMAVARWDGTARIWKIE